MIKKEKSCNKDYKMLVKLEEEDGWVVEALVSCVVQQALTQLTQLLGMYLTPKKPGEGKAGSKDGHHPHKKLALRKV